MRRPRARLATRRCSSSPARRRQAAGTSCRGGGGKGLRSCRAAPSLSRWGHTRGVTCDSQFVQVGGSQSDCNYDYCDTFDNFDSLDLDTLQASSEMAPRLCALPPSRSRLFWFTSCTCTCTCTWACTCALRRGTCMDYTPAHVCPACARTCACTCTCTCTCACTCTCTRTCPCPCACTCTRHVARLFTAGRR